MVYHRNSKASAMKEAGPTELIVPDVKDNREICFEQGKPRVYMPDDEPGIILTEWPNGVIDRWCLETEIETRHWPDGTTETAPGGTLLPFPHWPRGTRQSTPARSPTTADCPVSEVPARVGKTSARRHITGMLALNIPNRWLTNGGDWHTYASWFGTKPETIAQRHLTGEKSYGPLLDALRQRGLRDARYGLRHLNHPDGWAKEKVWAATHERAIIEWAWMKLQWLKQHCLNEDFAPFDGLQVSRWLAYPGQWIRLYWWAWLVRRTLDDDDARTWNRWRKQWTPWPEGKVLIRKYLSDRRTTFAKQLSRK